MRRVLVLGVVVVAGLLVLWFAFTDRGPGGEDGAEIVATEAAGSEETPADDAARVPRERVETEPALPEPDAAEEVPEEPPPFRYEVLRDDLPRGTVLVVEREDPDEEGWYVWSYVDLAGDREMRPFARLDGWAEIHMRLPDGRFVVHDRNFDRHQQVVFSLVDPSSGNVHGLLGGADLDDVGVTPLGLLVRAELDDEPLIEFIDYDEPGDRVAATSGLFDRIEGRFPGGAVYTAAIVPPAAAATGDDTVSTERWLLRLDREELDRPLANADSTEERDVIDVEAAPDGEHVALSCWGEGERGKPMPTFIEIRDGRTGALELRLDRNPAADTDTELRTVWLDARRLRYLDLVEEADADGSRRLILHAADVDVVTGERVGFHRVGPEDSELARAVEFEFFAREGSLPPGSRGPFRLVETQRGKPDDAELTLYVGSETVPALEVGALTGEYHAFRPHWFSPERRHAFVGLGPDTETREYALVTADPRRRTDYTLTNVRAVWWLRDAE